MKSIHIFNPENDMALAFGGDIYTPPANAVKMRADLQLLPFWYASRGDYVVVADLESAYSLIEKYPSLSQCTPVLPQDISRCDAVVVPWGWSASLRHDLSLFGVRIEQMPSMERIMRIRRLSHRALSIDVHRRMAALVDDDLIPCEFFSLDEVVEFARINPGCFIKAPWSGSGKGVFRVLDIDSADYLKWTSGVIRRQGSVICERALDKKLDFAMEFRAKSGRVDFMGYSVFVNDSHCSYDYGVVASQDRLRAVILSAFPHPEILDSVRLGLCNALSSILGGGYEGILGVDMMIYERGGVLKLNPCVEINLRMTMGAAAALIAKNHLSPDFVGRMYVSYSKEPCGTVVEKPGKVVHLTPVTGSSNYCAYVSSEPVGFV